MRYFVLLLGGNAKVLSWMVCFSVWGSGGPILDVFAEIGRGIA
jgi:hypothetical protein